MSLKPVPTPLVPWMQAAKQAVELAAKASLHSICVHGDSPNVRAAQPSHRLVIVLNRAGLPRNLRCSAAISCNERFLAGRRN